MTSSWFDIECSAEITDDSRKVYKWFYGGVLPNGGIFTSSIERKPLCYELGALQHSGQHYVCEKIFQATGAIRSATLSTTEREHSAEPMATGLSGQWNLRCEWKRIPTCWVVCRNRCCPMGTSFKSWLGGRYSTARHGGQPRERNNLEV